MKAKYLLLALLVFLCIETINAQSLFDKNYLQPATLFQALQIDNAGNIYIAGSNDSGNIIITKLDTAGNIVWDKKTGVQNENNLVYDMQFIQNQNLVLACSWDNGIAPYAYIFCIDTSGHILYAESISDTLHTTAPNNIISDSTGYTIGFDAFGDSCATGPLKLIRFDQNGNELYEREIDGFSGDQVVKCSDGNYLLFGVAPPFIIRVSNDFKNIYGVSSMDTYNYLGTALFFKLVPVSDSESYLFGNTVGLGSLIVHINNNNLQCDWFKAFAIDSFGEDGIVDAHRLSDKSWIFLDFRGASIIGYEGYGDYALVHTDSAFNILKIVQIDAYSGSYYSYSAGPTESSVFSNAYYFTADGYGLSNIAVIKTDTSFSGICQSNNYFVNTYTDSGFSYQPYYSSTCPSITPIDTLILPVRDFLPVYGSCVDTALSVAKINNPQDEIIIYPNPATNQLTIHTSSFHNEAVAVSIMNVLGQMMQEETLKWSSDVSLNINNLSAGMYFLQLKTESGSVVKRFVKE